MWSQPRRRQVLQRGCRGPRGKRIPARPQRDRKQGRSAYPCGPGERRVRHVDRGDAGLLPIAPARAMPAPIHHIDLAVADVERSLAFYLDLLGPLGWVEEVRYPTYR